MNRKKRKIPVFRGSTNVVDKFEEEVVKIITKKIKNRKKRIEIINELCEDYVAVVGKPPRKFQLCLLANEILREELTSKKKNKGRKGYPFLSERQLEERTRKETTLKIVKTYGTDGRDYSRPVRKYNKRT